MNEAVPAPFHSDDATIVSELVRAVYRDATAIAGGLGRATGLHPTDVAALRALDAAASRPTMRELGEQLGLSSPAVTGLVDRLTDAGLARRVPDREDRRVTRLELTAQAHDLAASHLAPVVERIRAAIDATSPADLAVVAAFLDHLVAPEPERGAHPEASGSDVAS